MTFNPNFPSPPSQRIHNDLKRLARVVQFCDTLGESEWSSEGLPWVVKKTLHGSHLARTFPIRNVTLNTSPLHLTITVSTMGRDPLPCSTQQSLDPLRGLPFSTTVHAFSHSPKQKKPRVGNALATRPPMEGTRYLMRG